MIKGVLYVRVSSKEQEEEGYSIDAQVEHGQEYACRHDIEIVRSWTVAESAKNDDREAFAELVVFMKSHRDVRAMVFEKADRMTRNFHDLVRVYDLIEKHDKAAHFFKENFHIDRDSKSGDKMRLDFQVVLARHYINNLSEEVKKGMHQKARKGGFPGLAPIGYLNDLEKHEIVVDAEQSQAVVKLFRLYAEGNHTLKELVDVARKEDLKYRNAAEPIGKGAIYHMLTNPVYYGMIRWGGEFVAGTHEPLISKALFDRVQEVLGAKNRPHANTYAFRAIGMCGHCGAPITAESKVRTLKSGKKRTYTYYHCTGTKTGKVCTGSYISEDKLARQLGEPLRTLPIDAQLLDAIKAALRKSLEGESAFHAERMAALQSELTKMKARIDAAYNDRLDGVLTAEEFRSKADHWRKRQAELQLQVEAHQRADSKYVEEGSRILDLAHRAYALYQKGENHWVRREILDKLVSNVVLKDGKAASNLREPFSTLSKLASGAGTQNGCSEWLGR